MIKPTAMDWMRTHMELHGFDWVAERFNQCNAESRKQITLTSFKKMLRLVRRELEVMDQPAAPSDVRSVEDLEEFIRLDPAKYKVIGGEATTWGNPENENHRVKLRFTERDPGETIDEIREAFLQDAVAHAPEYPPVDHAPTHSGNLLEIHIPDLHLGRISGDHDVETASSIFMEAVRDIIDNARVYQPELILMVIGSDWFNANGSSRATAFSKHPQDEDPRWMRTFTKGRQLAVRAIDYAMGLAPVEAVVLRGNHDNDTAFFLGDSLYAWYHNCPTVEVDNRPPLRKYFEWGTCLIGLTHGNDVKMDKLPMLMPQEAPQAWGRTAIREWHIGHFHSSQKRDYKRSLDGDGVRVEVMGSLTVPDEWTERKGFLSIPEAQGVVWNRQTGKRASFYYQPTATESHGAIDELLRELVAQS